MDWNTAGVWRPLAGRTGEYVPRDLPEKTSPTAQSGDWVVDPNDGYKFFVPREGTPTYTVAILRNEARKATDRKSWERKYKPEKDVAPGALNPIGPAAMYETERLQQMPGLQSNNY